MKKNLISSFFFLIVCMSAFAQDITGFWTVYKDETGKPDCIVAMYEYQDKYYGRIIGTYNDRGELDETIYSPKSRAPGIEGNPYYCGLDIVWGLSSEGEEGRYKGKIIDPKKGKVYTAEVWREGSDLIVRGEVWIFGANLTWPPTSDKVFTKNFKKPDLKKFVPVKPEVK